MPNIPGRWARAHQSVFARLVAIMVAMALSLLLLVGGFFTLIVGPSLSGFVDGIVNEYTRVAVASRLDRVTAERVGSRIGMRVRYEGPDGAWSTSRALPPIASVRGADRTAGERLMPHWDYGVVAAPDGGQYLFAWTFGDRMRVAHTWLHALLLVLVVSVVIVAHAVIQRLLQPLRVLSDGVAQLGDGRLDVRLPDGGRDEFGRLTDTFNAMVGRVRAMLGARDRLLADVSHELRSPLTRMKVTLELMPDDVRRASLAADVREMEHMVRSLLELERLRDGRDLHVARHDLVPILHEVADRYHDAGPGVRILASLPSLPMDVDDAQVRTVLRNLIENAVRHSPDGSAPIEISATARADAVEVRVTDDGVGVPTEDLDRLFEPFFRVDRSRARQTGGYGLGLSICKRAMEAHGGRIAVERRSPRGTTFVLTFPATVGTR